jgi:hypothetical protein
VGTPRALFFIVVLALCACGAESTSTLLVDLRTDYLPAEEFLGVRVTLVAPDGVEIGRVDHVPGPSIDYADGARIAELQTEQAGAHRLEATLVGLSGAPLQERVSVVEVEGGNVAVTIVITRNCESVVCSNPATSACLGARCVSEACTPETPEACGDPACSSDTECTTSVACAVGTCDATGSCTFRGNDTLCDAGEVCIPDEGCALANGGDWFDPAWTRRRRVFFDNTGGGEALTDFPVLVRVPPEASVGTIFVDVDGTVIAHEAEGTDAWVRIPEIEGASDDDCVWMYYENAGAPAPGPAAEVWSSEYAAVWHLQTPLEDASAAGLDLRDLGTTDTDGVVGRGRAFSRPARAHLRTELDDTSSIAPATLTVSAWVRRTAGLADFAGIVGRPSTTLGGNDFYLTLLDGDLFFYVNDSINTEFPNDEAEWQYLVGTYDGGELALFVDGTKVATTAYSGSLNSTPRPIILGADSFSPADTTGTTDFFDGALDEVRVQQTARSEQWIEAQHRSMTEGFVRFGPEQR